MKLLSVRRQLRQLQRIYNFNFVLKGSHTYTDSKDIWLQILTKPGLALRSLLDQVIIFLILKDESIQINGAVIKELANNFGEKLIRNCFASRQLVVHSAYFDIDYLQLEDWQNQLRYLVLTRIYANLHIAMKERITAVLGLSGEFKAVEQLEKYILQFSARDLQQIILYFNKV